MLLLGIGVAFCQQVTGSESVVYYSPTILANAGIQSRGGLFACTILIGLFKVSFIIVSACFLDSHGRRPMLLLSTGGITIALAFIALHFGIGGDESWLAVFSLCLFMAAFSIGIGPICWLLVSELFPLYLRAKALSIATFVNRITASLIVLTFLSMAKAMTFAGYFGFFCVVSFGTFIFVYVSLPETKGKTLEEITKFLDEGASTGPAPKETTTSEIQSTKLDDDDADIELSHVDLTEDVMVSSVTNPVH